MDASSRPSDAARELHELRERAYGSHPDIQGDPAALARLAELEAAAHNSSGRDGPDDGIGAPAPVSDREAVAESALVALGSERPGTATGVAPEVLPSGDPPRPPWHRRDAWIGRGLVVAGVAVFVLGIAYTAAWLGGPHPDATLHPTTDGQGNVVRSLMNVPLADVQPYTTRGYESYRGIEPWFFATTGGLHCFVLQHQSMTEGGNCVPAGVEQFADIAAPPAYDTSGLPAGSIIRFYHRGDSVDVFVHPSQEVD